MIVVLKQDSNESDVARVNSKLISLGLQTQVTVGSSETIIGLIGNTSVINEEEIKEDKSVEELRNLLKKLIENSIQIIL